MIVFIVPFMILAAAGFLLSVAVHLLALSGQLPPGGGAVFILHIGIFVVWIPAVLAAVRSRKGQSYRFSWMQVLSGCPIWMRFAAMALFGYAMLNFFLVFGTQTTHYARNSPLSPEVVRGFSGHWMLFYGLAFCILYSFYRKPWLLNTVRCPAGHVVAHSDAFCPTCGVALPSTAENA